MKKASQEDEIIETIRKRVLRPREGVIGIGDDGAVVPLHLLRERLVLSTDAMIEGTHFLRHQISPEDLAYKSLAVNLSDIAAMGGRPRYILLSLALPPDLSREWTERFSRGLAESAAGFGVDVLGGNTARSGEIGIHVTVIGDAASEEIRTRCGARPGDILCVTKTLGDSAGGLEVLLRNRPKENHAALLERHFRPVPQVEEGVFLAGSPAAHALMDLSDGLANDLAKMAEASDCGFTVYTEALPISAGSERFCREAGLDAVDLAITGGEDYALLVTVDPAAYEGLARAYAARFAAPLVKIGEVTERVVRFDRGGQTYVPKTSPFSHFT